jgi:hypothetical protein
LNAYLIFLLAREPQMKLAAIAIVSTLGTFAVPLLFRAAMQFYFGARM